MVRAIQNTLGCLGLLVCFSGQSEAGFVFDNSVPGEISVAWDETFEITSAPPSGTDSYVFLVVKDTYVTPDGAGLFSSPEFLSVSQAIGINGGSLNPGFDWFGWQYRPGAEFSYSSLDSAFGLSTLTLPDMSVGDSFRWVGSMTVADSGSIFRMPDIASGSSTSAFVANFSGQYSETISTTVTTSSVRAVPEPTSLAIFVIGGCITCIGARRRHWSGKSAGATA